MLARSSNTTARFGNSFLAVFVSVGTPDCEFCGRGNAAAGRFVGVFVEVCSLFRSDDGLFFDLGRNFDDEF